MVDGDPSLDIGILQQKGRLLFVMKGGEAFVDRLSAGLAPQGGR